MTLLFTHWERRYPYLNNAMPLAEEGLLVPFYVNGVAVGTIWTIAHRSHRKFDAEDQRLLESMGALRPQPIKPSNPLMRSYQKLGRVKRRRPSCTG